MAAPLIVTPNADLDYLLAEVAVAIQITVDQFNLASTEGVDVATWLGALGSPLQRLRPAIYPQGSMALETTVRPLAREEFDLDLVCQLMPTGMTAMQVYNEVHKRLLASPKFAPMLEKMNRCLRLNYPKNFHLDIIPAEPDSKAQRVEAIQVPDRELKDWTPSNPKGFIVWFTARSKVTLQEVRKRFDPLPRPTPADEKAPLTIAVQLMKRRRDMICDAETAPRSIVLTTLAGEYYAGTNCVMTALAQIVAGMQRRIREAKPGRITVVNPTNPLEKFCESFDSPGRYAAFTRFVDQLERDIAEINAAEGIPAIEKVLAEKFGTAAATRAVKAYGERHRALRDAGALKFTGAAGLSIVSDSAKSQPARPQTYFGDENGEQMA